MRGPVAKRYAGALLEISLEQQTLQVFQTQIDELAEVYAKSQDLRAILLNPAVSLEERKKVLRTIAERSGWHPLLNNFAMLLLDNERFDHIGAIAEEFSRMVDEHEGNVRATVTSAAELKDSQVATVKGALARLTGKNVLLETSVDEDLIGGVVARIGSMLYDGSLRTQLESMRESILDEV